jgi:phosphoserine phosphatase
VDSDLVVQAPAVTDSALAAVAAAGRASSIEAIPRRSGATVVAWRLCGARASPALQSACDAAGVDHAFVPRDRRWADLRVLAMDMDSTLITIECIDEIAGHAGLKAEVSAVTASAMRGELDFSESLRRRVALLAGLPVSALDAVYRERLALTPGAEVLLAAARAAGARTLLVSGGFTYFTERLRERLGLDETASNTLEIVDGKLTGRVLGDIVDARGKAAALARLRASLPAGLAVAIGDGANDLAMMAEADVSVAFHAKPAVRAQATHAIDRGGLDAVLNLFA